MIDFDYDVARNVVILEISRNQRTEFIVFNYAHYIASRAWLLCKDKKA
jgi:hypothetical protein